MLLIISAISDEETRNKIELIYEEYASAMYFKANSILQNKHDAEDAVQLSFEKIIKNADKIETPIGNKTRSFVLIVVENTAIDLYRKRKNLSEWLSSHSSTDSWILQFSEKDRNFFFRRI